MAGLLLASSLPGLALTQTATINTYSKPMLVASSIVPTGTYTNIVCKQLHWRTNLIKTNTVIAPASKKLVLIQSHPVAATTQPMNVLHTTKSIKNTLLVQVVARFQKFVSRSDHSEIVDHALGLLGVPYLFGGTSRSGFDCSGYSQYVFRCSGISLPRTASEQFNVGSSVNQGQLQSGDLVFFTTYAPGPSHVGIYIGCGHFVAASNQGVSISDLSSSYYANHYLGARRVS
ncbi:MAG: C40 family peptidase [Desulfosporosinus sp.]|nr:C40 family peptidase [Desulfosporosinus sp.]